MTTIAVQTIKNRIFWRLQGRTYLYGFFKGFSRCEPVLDDPSSEEICALSIDGGQSKSIGDIAHSFHHIWSTSCRLFSKRHFHPEREFAVGMRFNLISAEVSERRNEYLFKTIDV
jgi:hypothetical protein